MIEVKEKGWPSFGVSIGKAGLRVICDRADLIEELHKRYAGFTTESETQMDVIVKTNQQSNPIGLLNVKPIFTDRMAMIDDFGYRGVIDWVYGFSEIFLPIHRLAEDTEYFLRMVAALVIYHSGGLMFHAAGIATGDKVHVFFGQSGSGKTTVARNCFGKKVLNDDLIVLQPEGGIWNVYSTPFWNPTQVKPLNLSGKLHALYQLVQDKRVALKPITPGMALAEILASVPVINADQAQSAELLERCLAVTTAVPVYHLHFLPDETFWTVVKS